MTTDADFDRQWRAEREAQRARVVTILGNILTTLPGRDNAKIVPAETYELGGDVGTVTQPLNPDLSGLDVVYAEQVHPDVFAVIRVDRHATDHIRGEVVRPYEHKEYGRIWRDFFHAEVYLPTDPEDRFGPKRDEPEVSWVSTRSDAWGAQAMARVMTILGHVADQWVPVAEEVDRGADKPQRRQRVPGCPTCGRDPEGKQLMPPHDASNRCESGKRSHCSCDTCF